MRDIRPRAEEKARRRTETLNAQQAEGGVRPPGAGFETERARAKQALREEVNAQTGQSVRKIAASSSDQNDERILRVAAYCRVSTDDIDQVISIELQKNNYRDMIRANPRWKYVGTYVDDGFSGTNTEHRPAFNLMMKDAMAGKIDMIITKSVSRFARNLLDCIGWVRKLKEHDPPIPVFFEQENLNTLDTTSNIILFVLAMVAEEESHMKSEAMLLSLEWRFSRGRFITPALLGYDRVEVPDGHGGHKKVLVINENEAQTVRLMYYMLLNGSSTTEIAATLTELARETGLKKINGKPNTQWTASTVTNVLRNERYCGDVLARKTWTPDFHDHKSKKNRGKKNKYYQPGHHDAIVTRAQWNAAQRILNSHRYGHDGSYLPMRVIDHGALIGYISINRSWAGYEPDEYFRVCSIAMGMQEGDLEVDLENEHLPDGGRRIAGLTDENGVQRIARELSLVEKAVRDQLEGRTETEETEQRKTLSNGFQVVSAEMFSHAFEPVARFSRSSISFNSTCVSRLNRLRDHQGQLSMRRTEYVELLLNPVERMMVVRPCTADHPNAIRWADDNGRGRCAGASAFCRILFSILGWDENYSYRVPCTVRSKGDEAVLFFDLDNYIGTVNSRKGEKADEAIAAAEEAIRAESEDTRGIFFAADDDEEPQEIEDTEEMERRLQELAEIERRTFGTLVFEHSGDIRLPAIDDDGEWDVMAEPRILGENHRVDDAVVESLHDELLEALIAGEEDQ